MGRYQISRLRGLPDPTGVRVVMIHSEKFATITGTTILHYSQRLAGCVVDWSIVMDCGCILTEKTNVSLFVLTEFLAWASAEESDGDGTSMEEILEATDCIGDVSVSRGDPNLAASNGGYAWLITFLRDADSPCQQVCDSS